MLSHFLQAYNGGNIVGVTPERKPALAKPGKVVVQPQLGLAELVQQVKEMCRADSNAKAQWCAWCDANAEGTKDPNRMDAAMLTQFFQAYNGGNIVGVVAPAQSEQRIPELAEVVKTGQRVSASWKTAWVLYCQVSGDGVFDPMKHTKEFLQGFLEFLGSQGTQALTGSGDQQQSWGANTYEQPPAKRMRTDPAGITPATDETKLAFKIKELQRSDPVKRQQWVDFCDIHAKGVKDPLRLDADTLQMFFQYCV